MRILAVDYGDARVGLAISDETGLLATPLPAYKRTDSIKKDSAAIAKLANDNKASAIVIGYPKNMDGTDGPSANLCRQFAERISRYTNLEINFVDERLSTVEAARRLQEAGLDSRKSKLYIDSQSAVILLETYLNQLKTRGNNSL